jgi:dolichyl-phosphate-mannose-protein mannosyltransferase
LLCEKKEGIRVNKKDWRFMIGIFVIYFVFSFIQLGQTDAPETYWKSIQNGEQVTIDLGQQSDIARINIYGGAGMGRYTLQASSDGQTWTTLQDVNHDHVFAFAWTVIQPVQTTEARYLRLEVTQAGASILEMGILDRQRNVLPVQSISNERFKPLFDEQTFVPWTKTFMNSSYFDEIYHARTAYEFVNQLEPYETTHPPLGKAIQAVGIWLFGMNPFGWRMMGALAGALLIPAMYVLAKQLFRQMKWAVLASLFMAVDLLHFAQSRMGTVDTYIVLFVVLAYFFMIKHVQRWSLASVAFSGAFFGLASAVKWSGIYAGFGLAVLFLWALIVRYRETRAIGTFVQSIAAGIGFFIIVPALIYLASYIPYLQATQALDNIKDIWTYQKDMYAYHSQLNATHPFSSKWFEWPLMKRPLWLYSGADLPMNSVSTLVAIGNPILWWGGLFGFIWAILSGWKQREVIFVLIALLSLYVPWMLAPRDLTFIYHFFPMTPFWFLLLVFLLRHSSEMVPQIGRFLTATVVSLAVLVFIIFYPAVSGMEVSRTYATTMWKWLSSWQFF